MTHEHSSYCGHNGCACNAEAVQYCPVFASSAEKREVGRGELFHTIDVMSRVLDRLMPRENWFVISGGAVSLHQKAVTGEIERVPTDVDIVMRHSGQADGFEKQIQVYEAMLEQGIEGKLITHEREHHGFRFSNPIVEADIVRGVPVDILGEMITQYPTENTPYASTIPSLLGKTHRYPLTDYVFDTTTAVETPSGIIKIASPAFITFYKMTMRRNGKGKQDDADMCRLDRIGAYDNVDALYRNIFQLSGGNNVMTEEVLNQLFSVTSLIKQNG